MAAAKLPDWYGRTWLKGKLIAVKGGFDPVASIKDVNRADDQATEYLFQSLSPWAVYFSRQFLKLNRELLAKSTQNRIKGYQIWVLN